MGGRDEGEDALHDSFLKIFDKLDRFEYRSDAELAGWVRRVTVNHCLDILRKRRLKQVSLDSLPEGYRTVFNLFCLENWSHKEIGRKLGIGEKSSSSQYSRARALLAKKIKDYWNETEG